MGVSVLAAAVAIAGISAAMAACGTSSAGTHEGNCASRGACLEAGVDGSTADTSRPDRDGSTSDHDASSGHDARADAPRDTGADKGSDAPIPLPATFFGLTAIQMGGGHDPTVPFGMLRTWNTNAGGWWSSQASNTAPCPAPDFTNLNAWLARAHTLGVKAMWTAGRTPGCAISGGGTSGLFAPNGYAQAPSDIDSGDTAWKNFVTALVTDSLAQPEPIAVYECVNEFDFPSEWSGTMAQLVTFCDDMKTIVHALDPSAVVWGPSASTGSKFGVHGYPAFLDAGGASTFDVMNLHAYVSGCGGTFCSTPEGLGGVAGGLLDYIAQAKMLTTGPIAWSEGSWGCNTTNSTMTDDEKVQYLGREYIYLWNAGALSYVWYEWDANGNPLSNACGTMALNDVPGIIATAYTTEQDWLVGSTHTGVPCTTVGTTTTCSLTLDTGSGKTGPALILFDTTSTPTVSAHGFATQWNLDGTSSAVVSNEVTLSGKPILLH